MQSQPVNKILSGIEPIDELLGGLESGQLYLVHGEASSKSLFGLKFLIEGLKNGKNGALVIRYSPEDAVRRFAKLGYDCLEDVYSGRLVILEYSDDIIEKIGKLRELTPVLRELEWLLGEIRPERLIFDPVASVLAGAKGTLQTRADEFAEWVRSFGATVVLFADDTNREIIDSFKPLVAESFRFEVKDVGQHTSTSFLAFEKSPFISDQPIEVDTSRGIFMLGNIGANGTDRQRTEPHPPSIAELESIKEELRAARDRGPREYFEQPINIDSEIDESVHSDLDEGGSDPDEASDQTASGALHTNPLPPIQKGFEPPSKMVTSKPSASVEELEQPSIEPILAPNPVKPDSDGEPDELSHLLDDLTDSMSPLDLDLPELFPQDIATDSTNDHSKNVAQADDFAANDRQRGVDTQELRSAAQDLETDFDSRDSQNKDGEERPGRVSEFRIDSVMAARAVEMLLHPPETEYSDLSGLPRTKGHQTAKPEPMSEGEVSTKDFNVLIIADDSETAGLVTQNLGDYSLEVVHDGVSGLARLITFKPDLVVLDFDLPVIDGFKVLTLIRSALNVPIIILSGSRMRAIDRVMASELGADYYLTKPFSAKELKHKARQLIARYRGLTSWILNPASDFNSSRSARNSDRAPADATPQQELFIPYSEFADEVEKRVKTAMNSGAPFSIVGCRLSEITGDGGRTALRLFELVHELARDADLASTNARNDMVVMLADAGGSGARAFAGRLRARVIEQLGQEPALWMRSFPDLEESTEPSTPEAQVSGGAPNRRSSDRRTEANPRAEQPSPRTQDKQAKKADPLDSYIDFLDHL